MANSALKKITTRAKQLQRKSPGSKWTTLIKKAGAEYRAGKLGAAAPVKKKKAKKKKIWQTGSSNDFYDKAVPAKRPGKRKSGSGRTYTERRKNRSDKPGMMTGLKSRLRNIYQAQLAKACLSYELAKTVKATKAAQKRKVSARKALRNL